MLKSACLLSLYFGRYTLLQSSANLPRTSKWETTASSSSSGTLRLPSTVCHLTHRERFCLLHHVRTIRSFKYEQKCIVSAELPQRSTLHHSWQSLCKAILDVWETLRSSKGYIVGWGKLYLLLTELWMLLNIFMAKNITRSWFLKSVKGKWWPSKWIQSILQVEHCLQEMRNLFSVQINWIFF